MPAKSVGGPLPSPWKEFLAELDGLLEEPLELHCIGGFVFAHFYRLPRTTADIDYYTAIPPNFNLNEVSGQEVTPSQEIWSLAPSRGRRKSPRRLRDQTD
jgi:hypothetical protein